MSDRPDDLEARVSALEHDRVRMYEEIGAALVLARGADKDTGDFRTALRGHNKTLEALRETQLEQGREMREGFAKLAEGQQQISRLLERLAGPEQDGE